MISEAMRFGCVDARYHVSIERCAFLLGLSLHELLELEHQCSEFLQKKLTEIEHKDSKNSNTGKMVLGGVVGGTILLITGIIAAPLLIPVFLGGTAILAAALPASLGVSSAILIGGNMIALLMAPGLPLGKYFIFINQLINEDISKNNLQKII